NVPQAVIGVRVSSDWHVGNDAGQGRANDRTAIRRNDVQARMSPSARVSLRVISARHLVTINRPLETLRLQGRWRGDHDCHWQQAAPIHDLHVIWWFSRARIKGGG